MLRLIHLTFPRSDIKELLWWRSACQPLGTWLCLEGKPSTLLSLLCCWLLYVSTLNLSCNELQANSGGAVSPTAKTQAVSAHEDAQHLAETDGVHHDTQQPVLPENQQAVPPEPEQHSGLPHNGDVQGVEAGNEDDVMVSLALQCSNP